MDERAADGADIADIADSAVIGGGSLTVLSARAAAAALGINERTVRRAIARGDLPATKYAGTFRIAPHDLDRYRAHLAGPRRWPARPDEPPATLPRPPMPVRLAPAPSPRPPPLPVPLTPLVGREREAVMLADVLRMPDVRLVTLTGPGGVGKTRLALRVATEMDDSFCDGIVFVPLAPVRDPALVASTIARTLGLRESAGQPVVDTLAGFLRDRQVLLVLDNLEHLLDAAPLVVALLSSGPQLKALVTSRAPLRVSGEHDVPVPPLTLPDSDADRSTEQIGAAQAVRLFVARARAVRPDFALTDANAGAVAGICRRLDGLPLALELAAARTRHLPPAALLARLDQRLPLLTGGPLDQPPRLRTLRDAIAWSHDLLDADDQRLFRRLAVFVGGLSLEAAAAVTGTGDGPGTSVLDGIASLVDQSLLRQVEEPTDQPRFTMLETIREFGLEQLAASGEETTVRQAHVDFYLAEAERADLWGPEQTRRLARLATEHDNLRAALAWLLERGDADGAQRLGGALWEFWYMQGHWAEGRRWLGQALALGGAASGAHAGALTGAGALAYLQGDVDRAAALLEAGTALYRRLGDRDRLAIALGVHGTVMLAKGDLDRAQALVEASIAEHRRVGNDSGVAAEMVNLGRVAAARGDHERAAALLEQAVALQRTSGGRWDLAVALHTHALVADARGLPTRALALYQEALGLFWELADPARTARCLAGLAGVAATSGQPSRCARLLGAAAVLRERTGQAVDPEEQPTYEAAVAAARSALGEAVFAAEWAAGKTLPTADAVAEALALPPPASAPATPDDLADGLGLTRREREVLLLLVDGRSDRNIAAALFISPKTVGLHVSHLLAKLGVPSRAAAVAYAHRHGLIKTTSGRATSAPLKASP